MTTKDQLAEELRKYRFDRAVRQRQTINDEIRTGPNVSGKPLAYLAGLYGLSSVITPVMLAPAESLVLNGFIGYFTLVTAVKILSDVRDSARKITTLRSALQDLERKIGLYEK